MKRPIFCRLSGGSAEAMSALDAVCNGPAWTAEQFRNEFKFTHSLSCGARLDGALVGFVVAHAVLDEGHILNFGVAPQVRRQGIGSGLLEYALRRLRDRGVTKVSLEVREHNENAKRLYEAAGFSLASRRPQFYPDGEDGLLLTCVF